MFTARNPSRRRSRSRRHIDPTTHDKFTLQNLGNNLIAPAIPVPVEGELKPFAVLAEIGCEHILKIDEVQIQLSGQITSKLIKLGNLPLRPRLHLLDSLAHAIQYHFIHGQAPYPVERTLLVSGILDASMHSRHEGGQLMKTPQLEFAYAARDFRAFREMGASWRILNESVPQPPGICPNGVKKS